MHLVTEMLSCLSVFTSRIHRRKLVRKGMFLFVCSFVFCFLLFYLLAFIIPECWGGGGGGEGGRNCSMSDGNICFSIKQKLVRDFTSSSSFFSFFFFFFFFLFSFFFFFLFSSFFLSFFLSSIYLCFTDILFP